MNEITKETRTAYLGLGSNLGDRERYLLTAVERLRSHPCIREVSPSPIYETDPVGVTDQPLFLNMACRIRTTLAPEELLDVAMNIEKTLGRRRDIRWGPRTIDIDILLYDNAAIDTGRLTVPHPRMMERMFVLVPLLDVMKPEEKGWDPGFARVDTTITGVRKWIGSGWPEESGHSGN